MKKTLIAAMVASLVIVPMASAQDMSGTMNSGPWMMRHSTGNKTTDRVYYVMDRTLNSCEQSNLKGMFQGMLAGTSYVIQKAICNAIDDTAKDNTNYTTWTTADWGSDNGMSDYRVFNSMKSGLSAEERTVLGMWLDSASISQIDAVGKLVRRGGWANQMWMNSGMNSG